MRTLHPAVLRLGPVHVQRSCAFLEFPLLILQLTVLLLPPSTVANGLAPPTPLTSAARRHLFTPCHDPRTGRRRTPTPVHLGRLARRRSAAVVGQELQIASRLSRVAVLGRPNANQNPALGEEKVFRSPGRKKGSRDSDPFCFRQPLFSGLLFCCRGGTNQNGNRRRFWPFGRSFGGRWNDSAANQLFVRTLEGLRMSR